MQRLVPFNSLLSSSKGSGLSRSDSSAQKSSLYTEMFTPWRISSIIADDTMQKHKVTHIHIYQCPITGSVGHFARQMNWFWHLLVDRDDCTVPQINHKFLALTIAPPLIVSHETRGNVPCDLILMERGYEGFFFGMSDNSMYQFQPLRGLEGGLVTCLRERYGCGLGDQSDINLQTVARAFVAYATCFPDYHQFVFNCWFFCIGIIDLLVSVNIREFQNVMMVSPYTGLWKRRSKDISLRPLARLVFDAFIASSFDLLGAMERHLGEGYRDYLASDSVETRKPLRRLQLFELAFFKLKHVFIETNRPVFEDASLLGLPGRSDADRQM